MVERLVKDSGGFWSQFGPPIGAMILAVGLACWLKNKAVLNVWAWRAVHACVTLIQTLAFVFSAYLAGTGAYVPAALILSVCLILIPANIALRQYSYRSPALWNTHQ